MADGRVEMTLTREVYKSAALITLHHIRLITPHPPPTFKALTEVDILTST